MQEIHIDLFFNVLKGSALALLVIWTIAANTLVFVVLYKNPHLQTVPNLLVANLAFSDLCLGVIVLPLSSIYAIANEWLFTSTLCVVFVSADILCSTASIWNLSIVGLDRYWAITTPMTYMAKRNKRTAIFLILYFLNPRLEITEFTSTAYATSRILYKFEIHEAKEYRLTKVRRTNKVAERGNMIRMNGTWQCVFLDLPSYTIYSATGSFFIPLFVMFFVYYKIYQTFAKHRARQLYRQQVIKKHIESTILHELSHVLLTDDKFAEEMEENEEKESNSTPNVCKEQFVRPICKECKECVGDATNKFSPGKMRIIRIDAESRKRKFMGGTKCHEDRGRATIIAEVAARITKTNSDTTIVFQNNTTKSVKCCHCGKTGVGKMHLVQSSKTALSQNAFYKRRHHLKRQKNARVVLQHKPKNISTAKERRGVKVFGIILGCFAICWTPFFIMYVVVQFCSSCQIDPHIWMFITWLGYSNSAMNPIIYTVFNHDYQNALKGLLRRSKQQTVHVKR
ncbi:TYRA-2 protein [Loa loa]|uniref:TYRA-2 protein n=1 Tax=Loa loa TaxID=7209 RepID=A0A1S0U0W7_LOALO|nr:TYRA-2 protein [Loa loa]EFO23448.1 TYRA-2 protein [Loa loa]